MNQKRQHRAKARGKPLRRPISSKRSPPKKLSSAVQRDIESASRGEFIAAADPYWHTDANFEMADGELDLPGRRHENGVRAATLRLLKTTAAEVLADRLEGCDPFGPCLGGACSLCAKAGNRWFRHQGAQIMAEHPDVAVMTIVLSDTKLQLKQIGKFEASTQRQALIQTLDNAGLATMPVFGALDLSWNSIRGGVKGNFWQPHWTLFTYGRDPKFLKQALRPVIPRTPLVRNRLHAVYVEKTPDRQFSYAFKDVFDRRLKTTDDEGKGIGGTKFQIRSHDKLFPKLLLALDRMGLMHRFFLRGLHVTESGAVELSE